jgi:hypothetical protein
VTALWDIKAALAAQIESELCGTASPLIEELQATGFMNLNPTVPAIDVYEADPFQEPLAFGSIQDFRFNVRARVSTADHEAGQRLLSLMLDSNATTSMLRAIKSDKTLGNKVSSLAVETVSGLGIFNDRNGEGSYLGCTWTVRVMP